jgi:hypothetical protein
MKKFITGNTNKQRIAHFEELFLVYPNLGLARALLFCEVSNIPAPLSTHSLCPIFLPHSTLPTFPPQILLFMLSPLF